MSFVPHRSTATRQGWVRARPRSDRSVIEDESRPLSMIMTVPRRDRGGQKATEAEEFTSSASFSVPFEPAASGDAFPNGLFR